MFLKTLRQGISLLVGGLVTFVAIWAIPTTHAYWSRPEISSQPQITTLSDTTVSAPLLHYQGRLLDPSTGQAKPDGAYQMMFTLYTIDIAGSPLWSEVKSVAVSKGLFSTLLGSSAPLDLSLFNSQDLWLGVMVGSDPETAPRQRIAHVAYAIRAENAGNADKVDGLDAAAFAPAGHTHSGAEIVDGSIGAADLANGAVTSAALADESISEADIQNYVKVMGFPASALSFEPTGTTITQVANGLQWQATFSGGAFLIVPKPLDWDGVSDVTLRLYFRTTTATSGNVAFFIRPRAYNPGDIFADISSIGATPVAVAQTSLIQDQAFTIPATRFGDKRLWVITIQNQGTGSTYPDAVVVMSADLSYTAVR